MRWPIFLVAATAILALAGTANAQLGDLLLAPKTLFDRAIEARSTSDIIKDNAIVLKVNAIMAKMGTIKASTEIYEQRLLVTGLFDDKKLFEDFEREVRAVPDVKKLYWHVTYMSEADQEKSKDLISWTDAVALDVKVGVNLVTTRGVADVNFRVAVDSFANVYLIGRARSQEEMRKSIKVSKETNGARKIYNYVDVRP